MFQSPQWGSNSKEGEKFMSTFNLSFSPRNGEAILKLYLEIAQNMYIRFSPRNGEAILKATP